MPPYRQPANRRLDPYRTLGDELADLERTDPKVAAAAASYDEMVRRVTEDRSHAIPCTDADCEWHHSLSTQVDLLNSLGHPWEQDRAYNEGQQASRQTHGPGCVLCAEGRTPADHNLGDS